MAFMLHWVCRLCGRKNSTLVGGIPDTVKCEACKQLVEP